MRPTPQSCPRYCAPRHAAAPSPPTAAKGSSGGADRTLSAYAKPRHDAAYLAERTEGMDLGVEDRLDAARFNLIRWQAMKDEGVPYPTVRNGPLRTPTEELGGRPRNGGPPSSAPSVGYGMTVVANTSVRLDMLPEFAWTKNGTNSRPIAVSPS